MSEIAEREVYVVPALGTVVGLQDASTVAQALSDVRDLEGQLREAKRILTDALVQESARQGRRTLHLGKMDVEVRGGTEIVWDTEVLEAGLTTAGCPDDLIHEIILTEITYKVDARRAAQASRANPAYAAAIQAARTEIERPHSIVLRKP